jgi:small subunit ribosomal protein S2
MIKRRIRRARRRIQGTLCVTLLAGLLFWWWRRRTEKGHTSLKRRESSESGSILLETITATDDLTRIGGIGPKVAGLLAEDGIATFAQLAGTDLVDLRRVLRAAGLPMIDPETWPRQAQLAADGEWGKLEELQHQ